MLQSPKEFFGFQPGSDGHVIHWNDLIRYYHMLARESDRVRCIELGPTCLGNPFLEVIITSPGNMARLEEYRKLSMLLADPRDVDSETISRACVDGKAVCVQTMSAHAAEIGGTQMSPLLAYDLAAGESADILEILDNVVFILIPCFNPDGEIMIAEWYAKYRNTEYDGVDFPRLWHAYAGYANARDMVYEQFPESRYLNEVLFREWMPQAYADHHHMPRDWARFFIPPYKNPMRPHCSPILWREIAFHGANMAYQLEEAGVQGVISNEYFPTDGVNSPFAMTACHNIPGLLTESASARFASPSYVHPESLPDEPAGAFYPNPWPGGEWHLSDIVRQQYIAARALLSTMAHNRERILRNMVNKALHQTKAGAQNPIQAFLIPPQQHDSGCAEKIIRMLQKQGIELYAAAEPVETTQGVYPAGTVVVPLAQPKYALVMALLSRSEYPINKYTLLPMGASGGGAASGDNTEEYLALAQHREPRGKYAPVPRGTVEVYDTISENIAEYMGVQVVEAGKVVTSRLTKYRGLARPQRPANTYPGTENESFRQANALLAAGKAVYRGSNGDFYASSPPADAARITFPRIGIYQSTCGGGRLGGGNADEGQTRLLFEQYGFPYETVRPGDVAAGALGRLDVLLLADYAKADLNGQNESIKELVPEDRVWLGPAEDEKMRAFVRGGGRLLALGKACDYVIDTLGLKIKDRAARLSMAQYNTHGSMLRVKVEASPLTVGVPAEALVFHANPPILEISDFFNPGLYRTAMRFVAEHVLWSGLCVGEAYLAGQPCLVTASYGKGQAVLYAFSPQFRSQADGTFKVLFNALYQTCSGAATPR